MGASTCIAGVVGNSVTSTIGATPSGIAVGDTTSSSTPASATSTAATTRGAAAGLPMLAASASLSKLRRALGATGAGRRRESSHASRPKTTTAKLPHNHGMKLLACGCGSFAGWAVWVACVAAWAGCLAAAALAAVRASARRCCAAANSLSFMVSSCACCCFRFSSSATRSLRSPISALRAARSSSRCCNCCWSMLPSPPALLPDRVPVALPGTAAGTISSRACD